MTGPSVGRVPLGRAPLGNAPLGREPRVPPLVSPE